MQVPEGFIAFEELPGANTLGDTLEEARVNLGDPLNSSSKQIGNWLRNPPRVRR